MLSVVIREPVIGIEPTTYGLRITCAGSLPWRMERGHGGAYHGHGTPANACHGLMASMSRHGNCWGNIRVERISSANPPPLQLVLPFTELALYRGTEVVGTFVAISYCRRIVNA
jgi:hypothetical protein